MSSVTFTASASCEDPFSEPEGVLQFHLRVSTSVWQQMQASELSQLGCDGQYPYFEAQFRCGEEEEWLDIGFRRRRDRSQTVQKLPLKLDFNRVVRGQRWPAAREDLGFRKLSLNSGQPDDAGGRGNGPASAPGVLSAMLTEYLAWRMIKEELPEASGITFARLTLHFTDTQQTRYQGLYLLIEDIDRTAIKARYGTGEGTLFKTTDLACKDEVVFDDELSNSATNAFNDWLSLEPQEFVGGWYDETNRTMQLDGLLRQEALRELFANTVDTPLGALNNYFALDLYGARRVYLPWDLDDMFRPQPQLRDVDTPLQSSCVADSRAPNNDCSPIALGVNIRDNPEIRQQYLEILCRLTNGVAEETQLVQRLNAIDELIRPIIAEEVETLWASEGLDPLDADVAGTYAAEVIRMREWIVGRVQAVRGLIEQEGMSCSAGCEEGNRVSCDYWGCPSERSCVDGRWESCEAWQGHLPGSLDIDCDGVPEWQQPGPVGADDSSPLDAALDGTVMRRNDATPGSQGSGNALPPDSAGAGEGPGSAMSSTSPLAATDGSSEPEGEAGRTGGCSFRAPAGQAPLSFSLGWMFAVLLLVRRRRWVDFD